MADIDFIPYSRAEVVKLFEPHPTLPEDAPKDMRRYLNTWIECPPEVGRWLPKGKVQWYPGKTGAMRCKCRGMTAFILAVVAEARDWPTALKLLKRAVEADKERYIHHWTGNDVDRLEEKLVPWYRRQQSLLKKERQGP